MNSEAYWKKRRINQTPAELSAIALADKKRMCTYIARRSRELQRAFAQTQREISGMIEAFYKKYAGENGISLSDAKTYLTSAETKITLEEYYILVKQALGGDAQADALLNAAQKRRQITRLQALGMQLDGHAKLLGKTAQNIMQGTFEAVAEESYLRQIYDVQKAMGYGTSFTTMNRAKLRELCNRTWQGNRNWSQRIWGHVENLGEELERTLRLGISTGQSSRDMAAQLSARVGVARSRCMTLIRTEAERITEDATLAGYVETGVEEYQFLATLDNRTSPACQKLDMRHFPVKDAVTGRNYPPMHPNCRSTTVVYFGDEDDAGTRIARGDDGKTYDVPGDMTYEQWKRQYGDGKSGTEEKGIAKDADRGIMKLPNWEHVVIPTGKLTEYALNPQREPNKAKAFKLALGFGLADVETLIKKVRGGVGQFPAQVKGEDQYGKRYEVIIPVEGNNGKTANVLTAWIEDAITHETRLVSMYITEKKGISDDNS